MITKIKSILKRIIPPRFIEKISQARKNSMAKKWLRENDTIPPPPFVKQYLIKEVQKEFKLTTFVETGTYLGDMIEAQRLNFSQLISIELGHHLFKRASLRFNGYSHILILEGDSGKVLPSVLRDLKDPAIFFLDGHYSEGITALGDKECPIYEELKHILSHEVSNHVILIDDARYFTGQGDYPKLKEIKDYIYNKNSNYDMYVDRDIIYCLPV